MNKQSKIIINILNKLSTNHRVNFTQFYNMNNGLSIYTKDDVIRSLNAGKDAVLETIHVFRKMDEHDLEKDVFHFQRQLRKAKTLNNNDLYFYDAGNNTFRYINMNDISNIKKRLKHYLDKN